MPAIELSLHSKAYTGKPMYLEVVQFVKHIHDFPGVYLQKVEGCGYTVTELTPEEAIRLGECLIEQATKCLEKFKE